MKTKSKYPLLNNKDWLIEKYIRLKLGTNRITKLSGAKTSNSVRQALIRFDIPLRSIGEGLTCNREDDGFVLDSDSFQVLEGCLLGDGYLRTWKKGINNANAAFFKKNKYYDHILFVSQQILKNSCSPKDNIKEDFKDMEYKGRIKTFNYFFLKTHTHKELTEIYKKWYPESNGFKKLIPKDFDLTKVSLLHWFMDDGCCYRRKRKYKNTREGSILRQNNNQLIISFSSESFSKEDQERVAKQIKDKFDIDAKVKPCQFGTRWRIFIPQSQAQKFFEVIGQCPVPSLAYKWKLSS